MPFVFDLRVPRGLIGARLLAARREIRFVFQGDGAKRGDVERASAELPNVAVIPYRSRESLASGLSAGDIHLVSVERGTEGLIEPSKVYGIMAVGRPIVFVGSGEAEAARILVRERCGSVVASGDAAGLASALEQLADDAVTRTRLGHHARRAFVARYSRAVATRRFAELLEATALMGAASQPGAASVTTIDRPSVSSGSTAAWAQRVKAVADDARNALGMV